MAETRAAFGRLGDHAQDSGVQAVHLGGQQRISPIHGQGVLRQVIGADGQEVRFGGQEVGADGRGGRFDHDAEGHRIGVVERGPLFIQQRPDASQFLKAGDHRDHDAALATRLDPQDGAQLRPQQLRFPEADPHAAKAQGRIVLRRNRQVVHRLVAADVEGAQD